MQEFVAIVLQLPVQLPLSGGGPVDVSLYRLILDSLSEGVCTVDRDWTITYFNRAAERLTGVPVEEALGSNFV